MAMEESIPPEAEHIRGVVPCHFSVYDMKATQDSLVFYCHMYPDIIDERFELLRKELWRNRYIPFLDQSGGEYTIKVMRVPPQDYKSTKVNIIFLIATIITTSLAGTLWWASYSDSPSTFIIDNMLRGILFFTLPLMTILAVHEMGHYMAAKKNGVAASLPFFIPIPPFGFPLGTMGAFINMREPIPNKKALMEIGAAGPIAGFIVALPVAILGLWLTGVEARPIPLNIGDLGAFSLSLPPIYYLLSVFTPVSEGIKLHPTAFAGWVGMFVTFLNLLPMGQLDGGHVFRALLGKKSHIASYSVMGIMIMLSFLYSGWLLIVFLVLIFGVRHPPPLNDITPLGNKQIAVGLVVILLFAACIIPIPLEIVRPENSLKTNMAGQPVTILSMSSVNTTWNSADFEILNTGNTMLEVSFASRSPLGLVREGWAIDIEYMGNTSILHQDETPLIQLNSTESANIAIIVTPPESAQPGNYTLFMTVAGHRTVERSDRPDVESTLTIEYEILE